MPSGGYNRDIPSKESPLEAKKGIMGIPVSLEQFRQGMAMFATGVTVVSTLQPDGIVHGMTANAFTSVCLDPPLILVSIGHQRNTYGNVQARGRFGINILSVTQEPIARYYSLEEKGQAEALDVPWQLNGETSPRLKDALVFMECRVVAEYSHGDHTIFVAEVEHMAIQAGRPLLFFEGYLADANKSI